MNSTFNVFILTSDHQNVLFNVHSVPFQLSFLKIMKTFLIILFFVASIDCEYEENEISSYHPRNPFLIARSGKFAVSLVNGWNYAIFLEFKKVSTLFEHVKS